MTEISEPLLHAIFGPGTGASTDPQRRALISNRLFVVGPTMLTFDESPKATGERITAADALATYGFAKLREVAEDGSAIILDSPPGEPLQTWLDGHQPDQELLWRAGLGEQVEFVRDRLWPMLVDLPYAKRDTLPVRVVSTHRSKSVVLPVFEITTPAFAAGLGWSGRGLNVRLRMRYNFFNWIISVEAPLGISDRFRGLFDREAGVQSVYAEGFREEWVFGPYAEDRKKFTLGLHSRYEVWTFCWLLTQQ